MSYILKEQSKNLLYKSPLQDEMTTPTKEPKCLWTKDLKENGTSPHSKWDWKPHPSKILPNIVATVGNTPLVKLNVIPKTENIECEILGKCEFFNPAGSIKDRMVLRCIEDAERSGIIKPGATIIEATSGNTGIALAWVCAIKGYRCIIILPDRFSKEKEYLIRAFGGEVVRISAAPFESEDGFCGRAHVLHKQIPNSFIMDQFSNPSNALAHYDITAEEIYDQCNGQVDMIVIGCGSGGSLTGISRKFKEISPNTIIIGADPYGSTFAQPEELNKTDIRALEIEGIGLEMLPTICDRSMVEKWYKIHDVESLNMSRRLIKEEGLLVGTTSGLLMATALRAIKDFNMGKGKRVVVLLPDGAKTYLTKFVCDQWMEQRNFLPCVNTQNHWWWDISVTEIAFRPFENIPISTTLKEVLAIMDKYNVEYLPVTENENFIGLAIRRDIVNWIVSGNSAQGIVKGRLDRMYSRLPKSSNIGLVSRVLQHERYVVIVDFQGGVNTAVGIVTPDDLLNFIESRKQN